jgi:deazaflavin-dependent oxidoreductase (nitroreductase family)
MNDDQYRPGPVMRRLQRFFSIKPVTHVLMRIAPIFDRPLLKLSRGRLNLGAGQPILLLVVKGRKSGQLRETPLFYVRDGADFVLIASNGGKASHPAWYHNLRAAGEAELVVDGERFRCRAAEADGPERDRLWQRATTAYLGYEQYEKRTGGRRIPVIVLRRM